MHYWSERQFAFRVPSLTASTNNRLTELCLWALHQWIIIQILFHWFFSAQLLAISWLFTEFSVRCQAIILLFDNNMSVTSVCHDSRFIVFQPVLALLWVIHYNCITNNNSLIIQISIEKEWKAVKSQCFVYNQSLWRNTIKWGMSWVRSEESSLLVSHFAVHTSRK